jgi:hypothetical protein
VISHQRVKIHNFIFVISIGFFVFGIGNLGLAFVCIFGFAVVNKKCGLHLHFSGLWLAIMGFSNIFALGLATMGLAFFSIFGFGFVNHVVSPPHLKCTTSPLPQITPSMINWPQAHVFGFCAGVHAPISLKFNIGLENCGPDISSLLPQITPSIRTPCQAEASTDIWNVWFKQEYGCCHKEKAGSKTA